MRHVKSPALEAAKTPEDKLDLIALYLERMDRRDKWRMWGSWIHSVFTIVPILFFAWSTWYLYAHFNDIAGMMMRQTAERAAATTGQNAEDFMKQIREAFGVK